MEDKEQNKEVEYDPDMEALCLALKGEIPCKIHCTQYDMLTAIEIAKKYNVHFSLEHDGEQPIIWMKSWKADAIYATDRLQLTVALENVEKSMWKL